MAAAKNSIDRSHLSESIFYRTRNLCYHFAYQLLQDEAEAEEVVQRVMADAIRLIAYLPSRNAFYVKTLILILTRQWANQLYHEEVVALKEDQPSRQAEESAWIETGRFDRYLHCLNHLTTKDRDLVILYVFFQWDVKTISRLMSIRQRAVESRLSRSLRYLRKRDWNKKQAEEVFEDEALQQAVVFWLQNRLNVLEAIANTDPHSFSLSFDQETLQAMKKQAHSGNRRPSSPGRSPKVLRIAFLLFLLLLLIYLVHSLKKGTESPQTSPDSSSQASSELLEESSSDTGEGSSSREEIVKEERQLPASHYALYSNTVLVVDPKTNILYEWKDGGEGRRLLDLSSAVVEDYGIQHLGKQGDTIYIAFLSGRGGKVREADQPSLEMSDYWATSWFQGKLSLAGQATQSVSVDGILYHFSEK